MRDTPNVNGLEARSLTARVVAEVAEHEGVDPLELAPLHDAVDPDALEAIFAAGRTGDVREDVRVEFTYCDHEVAIDGGDVRVEGE